MPQSATPTAQSRQGGQNGASAEAKNMDLPAAAVRILNAAHRNGAVILRGQCGLSGQVGLTSSSGQSGQDGLNASSVWNGAGGIVDQYVLHAPVTLEPMDKGLQEIQARQQDIYWRESGASGVRVAGSTAKAALADILDRIAGGYRAELPRVWIYRECGEKKEMLVDVQTK